MTNRPPVRRLPLFLFLLLTWLVSTSCAGYHARQHAQLPTLQQAWNGAQGLKAAALREADAAGDTVGAAAVAIADAAITEGTESAMARVNWQPVDRLVEGDIVRRTLAGAITPGVAASLRERLTRFAESRAVFSRMSP